MESTKKHEQDGQHPLLSVQLPLPLMSLNLTFETSVLFSSGRAEGKWYHLSVKIEDDDKIFKCY